MTVYIVLEEDRGIGVTVSGVYATEAQAQASCGGHKWVAGAWFDDSAIRKECADRAIAKYREFVGGQVPIEEAILRAAIEGGHHA